MSLVAAVINPVKVDDVDALKRAIAERAGAEVSWWLTTEDDPGAGQTEQAVADGAKLVLVCGGDGTVASCAGALAGTGVAMAVVPDGTGNLLARNVGIPLELPAALEVAFAGADRQLDVLEAGDQRFLVMAGLGFDAALIRDTDEQLKARVGWLAYLGGLGRAIRRHRPARYEIRVDDQPPMRRRAIGVLVGNVGDLQAGITLLPDATPHDGTLDVITLSPMSLLDWPVLVGRILRGRPDGGRQADLLRGTRVRIRAGHRVPFEFDGDYVGERTELDVRVLAGALLLRCPAESPVGAE
ncbi:MAG TPA: diacylglycerol kinase family protein [Jatrophihabitans sp.]|nr:diacylglycerol kinase family protein [Jatrophihabitans sp.]